MAISWPASARAITSPRRRWTASRRSALPPAARAAGEIDWAARLVKDPAAQENITKPLDWQSYAYPFIYGQVDHNLFPLAEWRDCARQALGKKWLGSWTNDTWAHDDPLLVEQIRRRILPRRGIMASDDEILITLGAQNALYLLTSLLAGPDTRVAMEEPGYPDMRNIFRLKTRNVALIPVDEQGITFTDPLRDANIVFTTPSHQFPTTVTMPLERRMELAETRLAARHGGDRGRLRIRDQLRQRTLPGAQVTR